MIHWFVFHIIINDLIFFVSMVIFILFLFKFYMILSAQANLHSNNYVFQNIMITIIFFEQYKCYNRARLFKSQKQSGLANKKPQNIKGHTHDSPANKMDQSFRPTRPINHQTGRHHLKYRWTQKKVFWIFVLRKGIITLPY